MTVTTGEFGYVIVTPDFYTKFQKDTQYFLIIIEFVL